MEDNEPMNRCSQCLIPDTRPDTHFVAGVCSACLSHEKRPVIDWMSRKKELEAILDRHHGRCIVPSSGGKDSTYQAITLLEMGADVTLVTASTCHPTPIGRYNLDNLARYARTIEVTPNRRVRAALNRLGLEMVGDISWPEHAAIFSTPFRAAVDLGIPLIIYGENPQNQYGGPPGADQAREMTLRWRAEFGGFLGLRPADLVGREGITARDMQDYEAPSPDAMHRGRVEAHFLGQYIEWDSARNAEVAFQHGMKMGCPSHANYWAAENLDNGQTGLHDHVMYRKYAYGRGAAQISVDIRAGRLTREFGMNWIKANDGWFPVVYGGVTFAEMLDRIDLRADTAMELINQYTVWDHFQGEVAHRPILKEFA